jgi:hypothetical protein
MAFYGLRVGGAVAIRPSTGIEKNAKTSALAPNQARIELVTLAATRYGLRSTDLARYIQKHPTSVARWISLALRKQLKDRSFRKRIDDLDRRISRSARNDV